MQPILYKSLRNYVWAAVQMLRAENSEEVSRADQIALESKTIEAFSLCQKLAERLSGIEADRYQQELRRAKSIVLSAAQTARSGQGVFAALDLCIKYEREYSVLGVD